MICKYRECSNLTSVEIGNSVTSIGSSSFEGCSSLASIEIPNSVTSIGNNAFYGTVWFNNQSDGVVYAGKVAYKYKGTMPSGTVITLKNGTLGIGENAFSGRTNLTGVEIPLSISKIGDNAFRGCSGLSCIIVDEDNEYYDSRGNCNAIIETSTNTLIVGCKNSIIPNSVTCIGNNAFSGCSSLTSIEMPISVTSIGNYAFSNCSGLTSVEIGNSVTTIGDNAFSYCSNLASIFFPKSVTSIGSNVFWDCYALTSVVISNSVNTIGDFAFRGCLNLTSVEIPNSVTSIGDLVFQDCKKLIEIHWTPNADTNLSSALNNALLTSASRTLYLYKDAQNSDMVNSLVSSLDGQFKEIIVVEDYDSYDLTVTNAGMSTLYLDYPVVVPDDVNLLGVFYVFEIDGNIMLLKRLKEYIPADNGAIIMANAGTFTFNGTGDEVGEITDNQLRGVTENTPVSSIDGTVYTLGRGVNSGYMGFHKFTGTTIPANKAFLVRNASSGINSFNLFLDNEDGSSTAIGRIENGELIPESNVIYDLQGRRVENPSKGIYIVNGKKQYIK